MARYLPIILGVALIVGLTIPQINMTDRLAGTNVSAEQRAELLKKVPANVGDWHGEDLPIDPNVRQVAGAIGAVQREYHNVRTGEKVRLWLIVGHSRDVSFHTPDVCYPGQGFEARASENSVYTMVFPPQPNTPFFTNTFIRENSTGQQLERVFWTWYNPENKDNEGKVLWETPKNPRWWFGNTRALYKMYFTSSMRDPKELADNSACVRFARDFLPEVNAALAEVQNGTPSGESVAKPAAANSAAPAADVTKPTEGATSEPATAEKKAVEPTKETEPLKTEAANSAPKANP